MSFEVLSKGKVSIEIPFQYCERKASRGGCAVDPRVAILLHGFHDTAEKMMSKFADAIPWGCRVISVQAPFPVYREGVWGYSWYFYDFKTDDYVLDLSPAMEWLKSGLSSILSENDPLTLVGFSQGGYFASVFGGQFSQVKRVIAIGGEYLVDEIPSGHRYQADAIHGVNDTIVSCANSKKSHEKLLSLGWTGTFWEVAGAGHRRDASIVKMLSDQF